MRNDKAKGIMTERERGREKRGRERGSIRTVMITEPSAGVFNASGIMLDFHCTSQAPHAPDLTHTHTHIPVVFRRRDDDDDDDRL